MSESELPSRQKCCRLIEEYRCPAHIIKHCRTVAGVGVFLAHQLLEQAVKVKIELVERACLLHDLLRPCDFVPADYEKFEQSLDEPGIAKWQKLIQEYRNMPHEEAACDLLKENYPGVAMLIKKQRYINILDEENRPGTWEEKLVYYADLRVMHDRIVPLKERLREGHARNVHLHGSADQSKSNTALVDPLVFALERELFERIKLNPDLLSNESVEQYLNSKGYEQIDCSMSKNY